MIHIKSRTLCANVRLRSESKKKQTAFIGDDVRRKLTFLVILALITSVLVINFNQCDSECRRPRISDAMESGRKAAFVVLTGRPENSAADSSWLYPASEKVKNLKEFYFPAGKLETLTSSLK